MGQGLWIELATTIVSNITLDTEENHLEKLGKIVDLDLYNITFSKETGSIVTLEIKRGMFYRYLEPFIFEMIHLQQNNSLSQYNIDSIKKALRQPSYELVMQDIANGVCGYVLSTNLNSPSYINKNDLHFACTGIRFLSAYKFHVKNESITLDYYINLLKKTSTSPLRNAVIAYMI